MVQCVFSLSTLVVVRNSEITAAQINGRLLLFSTNFATEQMSILCIRNIHENKLCNIDLLPHSARFQSRFIALVVLNDDGVGEFS